jgi:hypothetical protein
MDELAAKEYVEFQVDRIECETTNSFALLFDRLPGRTIPTQLWVPKNLIKDVTRYSKGMVELLIEIDKDFAQRHHMIG